MIPAASYAGVFVSINIGAPPALPVYVQPELPAAGYIWTPGYWAYDEDGGYYWVPGAWVLAPYPGALWTPGYWAFEDSGYGWHPGYWGLHVGFYGGVNYGCGYYGHGFEGGYWDHDRYFYNCSVNNLTNVNITNVYNKTVINNYNDANRVSFNGGRGGLQVRPTVQELAYTREQHTPPIAVQQQNERLAVQNRQQFAAVNHGRPATPVRLQPASLNTASLNHGATPVLRGAAPALGAGSPAIHSNGPLSNNLPRTNPVVSPVRSPQANGQRPLITAHPGSPTLPVNRPAPPQSFNHAMSGSPAYGPQRPTATQTPSYPRAPQTFNQPRPAPAPNQSYGRPQQTYSAPLSQSYPRAPQTFNQPRPAPAPNQSYGRPQQTYSAPQRPSPVMSQPRPEPMQRSMPAMQSRPEPRSQPQPQSRGFEGGGHGGHGR